MKHDSLGCEPFTHFSGSTPQLPDELWRPDVIPLQVRRSNLECMTQWVLRHPSDETDRALITPCRPQHRREPSRLIAVQAARLHRKTVKFSRESMCNNPNVAAVPQLSPQRDESNGIFFGRSYVLPRRLSGARHRKGLSIDYVQQLQDMACQHKMQAWS